MQRVRDKFIVAQQGKCWLCGEPMLVDASPQDNPLAVTWDHVIPKSNGGGSTQDNLMLAHSRCNRLRGNSTTSY